METFSASLALSVGNSSITGEFPWQRPVVWSLDVFFDLRWTKGWVNNRDVGNLKRHRAHYDITVTWLSFVSLKYNPIYIIMPSNTGSFHKEAGLYRDSETLPNLEVCNESSNEPSDTDISYPSDKRLDRNGREPARRLDRPIEISIWFIPFTHNKFLFLVQSRYAPIQWETSLQWNDVSHWLGAYLDWPLFVRKVYRDI